MNLEFTDNGNCPPGFIDEGINIKGGSRRNDNEEKKWIHSMRNWPQSIGEAESIMSKIRNNPKAYDFENTTRDNSSTEHDTGDLGF